MNFNKICRICTQERDDLMSIFHYNNNDKIEDLSLKMKVCSDAVIYADDGLPDKICIKCIDLLNNAYLFKTLSEKSEIIFKDILSKNIIKCEENIKIEYAESDNEDFIIDDPLNPTFNCTICQKIYVNKYSYTRHMTMKHSYTSSQKKFKCYGCDRSFQTSWNRSFHELSCKNISEKTIYECRKCPQTFKNRKEFDQHLKFHKPISKHDSSLYITDNNTYQCADCLKKFKSKACLIQHIQLHSDKEYICEVCGRIFKRRDYLKSHLSAHICVKRHACPHCSFRANQRSTLTVHMRSHTVHRIYECNQCDYTCNNKSNLSAHRRRHDGLKSYDCKLCTKSFGYQKSLKEHIMITHEGLNQCFSCNVCNASYSRKRGLMKHINLKHRASSTIT